MMDLLERLEESGCTCLVCNHSFKLSDFFNFDLSEDSKEFIDVTPQLLKQEYDYLNGKIFGNRLGRYPLGINKRSTSAGITKIVTRYDGTSKTYTVTSVEISVWQHVTLAALRSVLAHEMIHVQMAEEGVESGHGPVFVDNMNRVNRMGLGFEVKLKRDIDDIDTSFKGGKKRAVFVLRSQVRANSFFLVDVKNIKEAAETLIVSLDTRFSAGLGFDIWVSDYPPLDAFSVTRPSSLEKKLSTYSGKDEEIAEIKKGDYAGYITSDGYDNKNAKIDLGISKADLGQKKLDSVSYVVIMMDDVSEAVLALPYKEKDRAIAWLDLAYKGIKNANAGTMTMYKSSLDWLKVVVTKPKWPWKSVPGFYKLKLEKADEVRNNSDKLGEFMVTRGWIPA